MPGPPPAASRNVFRVHPETGEVLFSDTFKNPRALVIDSSGTAVVTPYNHSGFPEGVSEVGLLSAAWEDRNFNSIRNLNRPLIFNNGGNPYLGALYGSGTITLTWQSQTAMVLSNIAATTVNLLPPSGAVNPVQANSVLVVVDAGDNAATNNITVNGNGFNVESPTTPGSFHGSQVIATNGQACAWIFDIDNSHYKFLWSNGTGSGSSGVTVDNQGSPIAGNPHTTLNFTGTGVTASDAGGGVANITIPGSSGITVESSGSPIANNPHTTLNFETGLVATDAGGGVANITGGMSVENQGSAIANNPHTTLDFVGAVTASDAGSGVASITVLSIPYGYVLVGNANPSTGNLSNAELQAIVDSSVSTTTVNAPDLVSGTYFQQTFRVTDDTGFAATNNIQVTSGQLLEDPDNHGNFATTVYITVNSQSVDWQWTGTHYKIV